MGADGINKKARVLLVALAGVCLLSACSGLFGNRDDDAGKGGMSDLLSPSTSDPLSLADSSLSAGETSSVPDEPSAPDASVQNVFTGLPAPEGMQPGQRPVGILVQNGPLALPQRGLAAADLLLEMPVKDGQTALMAFYADYRAPGDVGPVGELEDSFAQLAIPQDVILAHIGSTGYAANLINLLQYKTLDGVRVGSSAFWFDNARHHTAPGGVPNAHCWFANAGTLWGGMERIDVIPTGSPAPLFSFAGQPVPEKLTAVQIVANLAEQMTVGFDLDEQSGLYLKSRNGAPHHDESGALAFTNVLLLYCNITQKPDELYPEYDLSSGDGLYFVNGAMRTIQWRKGTADQPLQLFSASGKALTVQPGKTYVGFVPAGADNPVSYTGAQDEHME